MWGHVDAASLVMSTVRFTACTVQVTILRWFKVFSRTGFNAP